MIAGSPRHAAPWATGAIGDGLLLISQHQGLELGCHLGLGQGHVGGLAWIRLDVIEASRAHCGITRLGRKRLAALYRVV